MVKSLEIAKKALAIDLKDGESWCKLPNSDIAGNAYMSNFFTNMKSIQELHNAIKSYN